MKPAWGISADAPILATVNEVPLNATRTTHGRSAAGLWWRIGTRRYRRASRLPWRSRGAGGCRKPGGEHRRGCWPARDIRAGGQPGRAPRRKGRDRARAQPRSPAAAQDAAATAVTATTFGAAGAQAVAWTRPAGTATWRRAGAVLPAGFGSSYDPAAAAVPSGPLLVVAGTAPPGEQCITNRSVAIASVGSGGRIGGRKAGQRSARDGHFDDRPMVAVGEHGTVWVAWSQGPDADACQDVGTGDRIEVAVSRDAGRTFGAPIAMPADGGHSAFGVRLAPLPGGRVAVSWTETTGPASRASWSRSSAPTDARGSRNGR